MANRLYVKIKDQNGQNIEVKEAKKGRGAEAYGFETALRIPVDKKTGLPMSTRQYAETVFYKSIDRSSPLIKQYMCESIKVPELMVFIYEFEENGKEKLSYQVKFEEVTFTGKEIIIANAFSKEGLESPAMEKISFVAEGITEIYLLDGHMAYKDCYKEGDLMANVTSGAATAAAA